MDNENNGIGGHISTQFDEDLEALRTDVLNMGGLVENQIDGFSRKVVDLH